MTTLQNSLSTEAARGVPPEDGRPPTLDVGARIRELRQLRRCTLRVIADRTGLTEGFLSQVERGRANASLASLQRITAALGVDIADLFDKRWDSQPRVLRRGDRPTIAAGQACRKSFLTQPPFRHLDVAAGQFDVGGSTGDEQYAHGDSEELFVVISGTVELHLGDSIFEMTDGDCIDYQSSVPHRAVNVGPGPAEVMWIMSPPTPEAKW